MAHEGDSNDVSLEEWERCLKIVSYCVLGLGPALAPVLEARGTRGGTGAARGPLVRARRHLEGFAEELGHRPKTLGRPVALISSRLLKLAFAKGGYRTTLIPRRRLTTMSALV
jgi:hypothetical protein